jgi:protein-S-isoprenylcysteine O-methyltransferase Ste14
MDVVTTILVIGWIVFWVYWFAAAASGIKAGRTRWGQFAGSRVAIVVIVVLLVRAGIFKAHTETHHPWVQVIGIVIFFSGLAFAVWARLYLGRNWGSPMSQKVDPELITNGPYRRVRHPIYSGIILGLVGTAVAIGWSWLIAAALLGAYFIYSAVMEERYMAGLFPDTYPEYRRTTKMLVPFIF